MKKVYYSIISQDPYIENSGDKMGGVTSISKTPGP